MKKNNLWLLGVVGFALVLMFKKVPSRTPEQNRALFQSAFAAASKKYNMPPGLLERVAQQESSFRDDIIYGPPNAWGAQGLMQIIKKWHPTSNPGDPISSIDYAASYLRELYDRFGNWAQALQGYNWGPSNVDKYIAGTKSMPTETTNYYQEIMADVGIS